MTDALLSLGSVSKSYWRGSSEVRVLSNACLELHAGEFMGVWGRRGAGKTTLLRIAAGLETPDRGAVRFDGEDLSSLSEQGHARLRRGEVGWVRRSGPRSELCILDYVALPLLIDHGQREANRRAERALRRVGMAQCASQHWESLSDGERALVAIAHGIARSPRLLLIDDPTANLGVREREEILLLLRALVEETRLAVLMTVPDMPTALRSHRAARSERRAPADSPSRSQRRRWRRGGQRDRFPRRSAFRLDGRRDSRSRGSRAGGIGRLVLELRELVKHFPVASGAPVRAVDGVSLSVPDGEFVALYGPSGSGKTTLLMLIAALLRPDAGSVLLDERDISRLTDPETARYRLHDLGFVRQSFNLIPGATALDNAALKLMGMDIGAREARRRITPLLERLGLGERTTHRAEQLSMGERQRVMLARALSTEPKLLLADEPTGSLDSTRGREVLELLAETCRERSVAVVLVTHDPQAASFADRVFALRDGRLVEYEPGRVDAVLRAG